MSLRVTYLSGILSSLRHNSTVFVLIREQITIMQPYESKMNGANANLTGFADIQTTPTTLFNEFYNKEEKTYCVTYTKLEKLYFKINLMIDNFFVKIIVEESLC